MGRLAIALVLVGLLAAGCGGRTETRSVRFDEIRFDAPAAWPVQRVALGDFHGFAGVAFTNRPYRLRFLEHSSAFDLRRAPRDLVVVEVVSGYAPPGTDPTPTPLPPALENGSPLTDVPRLGPTLAGRPVYLLVPARYCWCFDRFAVIMPPHSGPGVPAPIVVHVLTGIEAAGGNVRAAREIVASIRSA